MKSLNMAVILLMALLAPISVFCELQMVALIFRHGDRTPFVSYPNDPHRYFDYDGLGFEALTPRGVQQMYDHGSRLKKSYESLFAAEGTFRNYNFQAKTSETERSLMSGLSLLAGFYPPSNVVNPLSINWQPIPITTIPAERDFFIKQNCQKAFYILGQMLYNPPDDLLKMMDEDSEMIRTFEENTGIPDLSANLYYLFMLFDTLKVQNDWNLELPSWVKPEYLLKHEQYMGRFLSIMTETDELKKLVGGPLVTDIMDEMFNVTQNGSNKRVFIYSGHDATVSSLVRALAIDSQMSKVFDYGATVAIELHDAKKTYEIKIKFYPSADSIDPIDINIPNCNPCYLDQFASQYQHLIVRDPEGLCEV